MMLTSDEIEERLKLFQEYLTNLQLLLISNDPKSEWKKKYEHIENTGFGEENTVMMYVLLYPIFYEDINNSKDTCCEIRGKRTFQHIEATCCEAERFFGVKCNLDLDNWRLELDHYFPWSLGGVTSPDNLIKLCNFHHKLKGISIMLYCWEYKDWIRRALETINRNFI